MTFGFLKSPFFAHFQANLIFETIKVIIWFHFATFIELFLTYLQDFRQFLTHKCIGTLRNFCRNHQ